jgi:hypothetical protein
MAEEQITESPIINCAKCNPQRAVMLAGVVVFALMGLFPPWAEPDYGSAGYGFIGTPPDPKRSVGLHIDVARLIVQWVVLAAVVGTTVMLSKPTRQPEHEGSKTTRFPDAAIRDPARKPVQLNAGKRAFIIGAFIFSVGFVATMWGIRSAGQNADLGTAPPAEHYQPSHQHQPLDTNSDITWDELLRQSNQVVRENIQTQPGLSEEKRGELLRRHDQREQLRQLRESIGRREEAPLSYLVRLSIPFVELMRQRELAATLHRFDSGQATGGDLRTIAIQERLQSLDLMLITFMQWAVLAVAVAVLMKPTRSK